jgi:hypothetical protein
LARWGCWGEGGRGAGDVEAQGFVVFGAEAG